MESWLWRCCQSSSFGFLSFHRIAIDYFHGFNLLGRNTFDQETTRAAKCLESNDLDALCKYATPLEFSSLNILDDLKTLTPRFGLSDHSGDLAPGIIGITKGAQTLEVHMTPHEMFFGPDVSSSLSYQLLCQLVKFRNSFSAITTNPHSRNELFQLSEGTSKIFRKGIYWAKDHTAGEIVDLDSFSFLKPSNGVDSIHFEAFLGKKLSRKVQSGLPFLESDVYD